MKQLIKTYLLTNLIVFFIVITVAAQNVQAVTIPTFPSCLNPQGEVKVINYGTHGIPGDPNAYTGYDAVYYLTEDTILQCLCPENGNGIQTNWWNVSHLSKEEIDQLVLQGWIYVPNGSAWGLVNAPYLAQNIPFSCIGGSGGGGSSSSSSSSGGEVSGVAGAGEVFGLASTGNSATLYVLLITGISLLLSGIYIRNTHNTS